MRAFIIVDLGFGDAGKGLLTDFLTGEYRAGVVVRYNGGAQAGHNVVTADGRQHTFSQFGSGSFHPGVRTILSKDMVLHPTALLIEGDILREKGCPDIFERIQISDQALVITPFHQAANHIREMLRGQSRHGSCGVGVGETVADSLLQREDCIRAADLLDEVVLRQKLKALRLFKREQIETLIDPVSLDAHMAREWQIFARQDVIENWLEAVKRFHQYNLVIPDEELAGWMQSSEAVIYEGAQGVLLDAETGFFPHVTWSDCTTANAGKLVAQMLPGYSTQTIAVLRSHAVRHGGGPLPTEAGDLQGLIAEHNQGNTWQGQVRYGWFDGVLANHALRINGPVDALCVTHMDLLPKLSQWQFAAAYRFDEGGEDQVDILPSQAGLALEKRSEMTGDVQAMQPIYQSLPAHDENVNSTIEDLSGQPVRLISRGQTAGDVSWVGERL